MASVSVTIRNFFILSLSICCIASKPQPQPYIVYMGSSSNANGGDPEAENLSHKTMLSSIIPTREVSDRTIPRHSYHHSFKGFSAMLTEDEALLLSGHEEVLSVFPDPALQLHTTRSWDFLELEAGIRSDRHYDQLSSDVIIGVIDTGIWPELPSFSDRGIDKIPSKWKGICMQGSDFKKSNCNRKLIGARFYDSKGPSSKSNATEQIKLNGSPRDSEGHGSHTASIAAGAIVANASYYGLAQGKARGGLPSARIATYKACTLNDCRGSALLKAIDDAIEDGVDIISISIGIDSDLQSDFMSDPIAIGAFHAAEMGVMVVASAGNEGPNPYTVVNSAPWLFTVAASSIDRDFESTVILGNKKAFKGNAINFSPLNGTKTYPLAFGDKVAFSPYSASEARFCLPGSLDSKKVSGKIVICLSDFTSRIIKKLVVEDAKARGMILIDVEKRSSPIDSGIFPFAEVGNTFGSQILKYLNSTKNPTATILPTIEVRKFRSAPVVADFSSRGPGPLTENILKPDIMAPGVAILAAMIPKMENGNPPPGKKPSAFGIRSGTSMACPHVTGVVAFVKTVHNNWSFSMIKSAIMTTATISNNVGKPMTNTSNDFANPHEIGAGEINPIKALDPGLVLETTSKDHLYFLCHFGYKEKNIKLMTKMHFKCPNISSEELISNINYPSISIGKLSQTEGSKIIKRVMTNVGSPNTTYASSIQAPADLLVKLHPEKLTFIETVKRFSFQALFDGKYASKGYKYGAITWFDGSHTVRITFAVNII